MLQSRSNLKIRKTSLTEIQELRHQFLQEVNCQIRYDSCHIRNWADEYLLILEGKNIGYGSIKGKEELADRDAIFEFYVLPVYRKYSSFLFEELIKVSASKYIECQTNDIQLTTLLYEFGHQIYSETILFEDQITTFHQDESLLFRQRQHGDNVFGKVPADEGEYVLIKDGEIIADSGFLLHYNHPYADLYMETAKKHRNKGYASFILQELKKECYLAGRVPAARCNIKNKASKAALIKAGMRVCGYMLIGKIRK